MASIRGYLHELESRLAPSLDLQSLQERLTEAENHLRDRAQEFEEIGLPPLEAEARAVAAFGVPDEYTADLPPQNAPAPPVTIKPKAEVLTRDVALQLAWSAIGIGLVSMLAVPYGGPIAAGAAAFVVFAGALFGRATSLWRFGLLSAVAAVALFPVLLTSYVPTPINSMYGEGVGVRHRHGRSYQSYIHEDAVSELRTFEHYRQMAQAGTLPKNGQGKYLAPGQDGQTMGPVHYSYGYRPGIRSLESYDDPVKARTAWVQEGDLLWQRLTKAAFESSPESLVLNSTETAYRFAAISALGGVVLMAILSGAQAFGMALRAFFIWLRGLRRRIFTLPVAGMWESPPR